MDNETNMVACSFIPVEVLKDVARDILVAVVYDQRAELVEQLIDAFQALSADGYNSYTLTFNEEERTFPNARRTRPALPGEEEPPADLLTQVPE